MVARRIKLSKPVGWTEDMITESNDEPAGEDYSESAPVAHGMLLWSLVRSVAVCVNLLHLQLLLVTNTMNHRLKYGGDLET